jgi:ubiquinone/menaquinone biosynthesis C-methylase UbiE
MGEGGPFQAGSIPDGYHRYLQPAIFEPWAERLLDFVGICADDVILDVASGTGVVARAAAVRAGRTGRVIASDISPGMLAHVGRDTDPEGAPVETLECPATEIRLPDASIDVVLCQQGFQFFTERGKAAAEMHRVLRPGGRVGVAAWRAGAPPEPFETYARVLQSDGVPEPSPRAYDTDSFTISADELERVLTSGGFSRISVRTEELVPAWDNPEHAALGITGTTYGAAVAALDPARQQRLMARLCEEMSGPDGAPVRRPTVALLARGVAA